MCGLEDEVFFADCDSEYGFVVMLQAQEAMRNMDELLLFLQKSSERHNSIAYAFEGKKADKQT